MRCLGQPSQLLLCRNRTLRLLTAHKVILTSCNCLHRHYRSRCSLLRVRDITAGADSLNLRLTTPVGNGVAKMQVILTGIIAMTVAVLTLAVATHEWATKEVNYNH